MTVDEAALLEDSPPESDVDTWITIEELPCSVRVVGKDTLEGTLSMPLSYHSVDVSPSEELLGAPPLVMDMCVEALEAPLTVASELYGKMEFRD